MSFENKSLSLFPSLFVFLISIFFNSSYGEELKILEEKARRFLAQQNYYSSSRCYEKLVASSPLLEHYLQLAKIYRFLSHPKKMKETIEKGLAIEAQNFELLLEKARYYKLQFLPELAIPLLQQLEETKPYDFELVLELAENHLSKLNFKASNHYLALAEKQNPTSYLLQEIRVKYLFKTKQTDKAIEECWSLLEKHPLFYSYPFYQLGNGWVHSNDLPERALNPENPSAAFQKAFQFYQGRDYEKAVALFPFGKEEEVSRFYLGCIYLQRSQFLKAEEELTKSFYLRKKNARNLNSLAMAKIILSWKKKALAFHPELKDGVLKFPTVFSKWTAEFVPHFKKLSLEEQELIQYSVYPFHHYLEKMIEQGVLHHIMDYNQQITDFPALAYMKLARTRTFDGRLYQDLRGVGGKEGITSKAALLLTQYATINVFAHEFAHQVMSFGFGEKERKILKGLYQKAKRESLFLDDYASSSVEEYFAQGYEAYIAFFKRPWVRKVYYKNTQALLRKRDPELFQFIETKVSLDFINSSKIREFKKLGGRLQKEFNSE